VKPRITMNLSAGGELEIWLNAAGRDVLVRELNALNETNEHFHLFPAGEVDTSATAYRPTDKLIFSGKVLFRTDEWDREHFPHVMTD
jgi:hypothetical protein